MTRIGYARVSTEEQCLDLQRDALREAGCARIYEDEGISALSRHRPGFDAALGALQSGDALVLWKFDRAFRSLRHALDVLDELERRQAVFLCLTEAIDTSTLMGKCFYQFRHVVAELETGLIRERTIAGMAAARRKGIHVGRPRKLKPWQVAQIHRCLKRQPHPDCKTLARQYRVSPQTIRRVISTAPAKPYR